MFVQDSWTIAPPADAQRRRPLRAPHRQPRRSSRPPPGEFVPARTFAAQSGLIAWNTVVPRIAARLRRSPARGRTVLKAQRQPVRAAAGLAARSTSSTRCARTPRTARWSDRNGDLVPQLDEIGPGQGAPRSRRDGAHRPGPEAADAVGGHAPASSISSPTTSPSPSASSAATTSDLTAVVNVAVSRRRLHAARDHQPARRHAVHHLQPVAASIGQRRQRAAQLGSARRSATRAWSSPSTGASPTGWRCSAA